MESVIALMTAGLQCREAVAGATVLFVGPRFEHGAHSAGGRVRGL